MSNTCDPIAAARPLIWILKCIGLWLWQSPLPSDTHYSYFTTLLAPMQRIYRYLLQLPLTFTIIALMWVEVFRADNMEQAGTVLYLSLAELGLVVKILYIWRLDSDAWNFMHSLEHNDAFKLRDLPAEREMWQRQQRNFKRVTLCHIGGSIAVLCTAFPGTIIFAKHQLPFRFFVPFDMESTRNFWLVYAYDFFAITLTAISNSTMDIMLSYFMFHIALLYKLIGERLKALHNVKEKEAIQELRKIFHMQQQVQRLTGECEKLISVPITAQIMLSAFIICFCIYRLRYLDVRTTPEQFFTLLQFVFIMALEIYLPCYYANEITINANMLTNCVYSCDWTQFSPATRKVLILYMEFLKKAVSVKAGNFFRVGLPIFTKTINNAYSLLALLLNMDN